MEDGTCKRTHTQTDGGKVQFSPDNTHNSIMGLGKDKTQTKICVFEAGRQRYIFKKTRKYLKHKPRGWRVVVEDESIFIYDAKARAIWAVKGSKPVLLTTGSHKFVAWFGALADDGTQLFRHYDSANSDAFLDYLMHLTRKYPKMILFLDKATYHKKEKRVKKFFRNNRSTIRLRWFPSGFPEANPMEECWRQGKDDIVGSIFHDTFKDFMTALSKYYRTKRFRLDLYKYLCQ